MVTDKKYKKFFEGNRYNLQVLLKGLTHKKLKACSRTLGLSMGVTARLLIEEGLQSENNLKIKIYRKGIK